MFRTGGGTDVIPDLLLQWDGFAEETEGVVG